MCMQGPFSPPTAGNALHEVASDPQLTMDEEEHQMRGFSAEERDRHADARLRRLL